jgi:hypothetical protein
VAPRLLPPAYSAPAASAPPAEALHRQQAPSFPYPHRSDAVHRGDAVDIQQSSSSSKYSVAASAVATPSAPLALPVPRTLQQQVSGTEQQVPSAEQQPWSSGKAGMPARINRADPPEDAAHAAVRTEIDSGGVGGDGKLPLPRLPES